MSQKLNIISERLIIAWSGSLIQARAAIREISELDASGDLTRNNVLSTLENIPPEERSEISLVGTVCTPENGTDRVLLEHFEYNANARSGGDQQVVVSGSGERAFTSALSQIIGQVPTPMGQDERFLWAEKVALVTAAQFIGDEMTSGGNLVDWWGGGVEVATYRGGRFVKHGNILNTFWHRRLSNSEDNLALIGKFIKCDYFEDVFVVQKFEGEINADGNMGARTHAYWACTPLLKGQQDYDFRSFPFFDLSYTTLNCYVLCELNDSSMLSFVKTFHNDYPFEITLEKECVRWSIGKDLVQQLGDETRQPPRL
jgi:hypothetical protein